MGILRPASGLVVLWLMLHGCAVTDTAGTRQYLDSITAATVAVSTKPLVFARERPETAANLRDYLTVYWIEINRSGDRRTYLVAHAWSTAGAGDTLPSRAMLNITADDRTFLIQPLIGEPRSIGIGDPIVSARGRSERIWYYPIAPEQLVYLTTARTIVIAVSGDGVSIEYQVWRTTQSSGTFTTVPRNSSVA